MRGGDVANGRRMRALSIRQPYAELILRAPLWIKTVELRSRATTIVGERFYLYECKPGCRLKSLRFRVVRRFLDQRVQRFCLVQKVEAALLA